MTVCQRHLLVHGSLAVLIPPPWASPSYRHGHLHPTTMGISSLQPWASPSHHHGYLHPTTIGIPIPPPQASLSHYCEHPTTARTLPTSLLNVVTLEGSGSGYDNIPEVCKALKWGYCQIYELIREAGQTHLLLGRETTSCPDPLLTCFVFIAIYQHLPYSFGIVA